MKSKHEAFYKKYASLKSQGRKLELMKQYMLSLSSEDLSDFLLDDIKALGSLIEENKLTTSQRELLALGLSECADMLKKMKARRSVNGASSEKLQRERELVI